MNILVTGGVGYIGGFMVKQLLDQGDVVVVLDSLERSRRDQLDSRAVLAEGSLLDQDFVKQVFANYSPEAVIHFAGYISVPESVQRPELYFSHNVTGTLVLLDQMVKSGVGKIIFSSSAAVYGSPKQIPIPEDHPKAPESPYGESKLMVERIIEWYGKAHGFRSVALRYFNAAGAALDGTRGEAHAVEGHIIPLAITACLNNRPFKLFGDDYSTKDGTCVRDYIHVLDLVQAHLLALKKIESSEGNFAYNVGTGKGYSNQEIVDMVKMVSQKDLVTTIEPRRPGDPAELVAQVDKIKEELGFSPQYSDLETIISSAWKWHAKSNI